MDVSMAGQGVPSPSFLSIFFFWSWVCFHVTSGISKVAVAVAFGLVSSVPTPLKLYVTGIPHLVNRLTIAPRWKIRVAGLSFWAKITGRSFVVRQSGQPPLFIGRPSSKDVHVFCLTSEDINHIYMGCGINARTYLDRNWRPDWRVRQYLTKTTIFNHPIPPVDVDLTPFRLIGPRLTQGHGLIGNGIRIALIEEYGRWPREPNCIAGKGFSWTSNSVVHFKFPTSFVAVPGVRETVDTEEVRITVEWQDLEAGILRGPKVTGLAYTPHSDPEPDSELPPLLDVSW
jgi:hypothetical protein